MSSNIIRKKTPEERELERKRAVLASLENKLAQKELERATLQAELTVFDERYKYRVGRLFVELDEIKAQLAEAQARRNPQDTQAQTEAAEARARATETAEDVGAAQAEPEREAFAPSQSLKDLFRKTAKAVHPDLATDDEDRARRERLMAEANEAYAAGDAEKLQAILDEWENGPDAVQGSGVGADLIRLIRQIALVEERIVAIEREMADLQASDLAQRKAEVETAAIEGRDLLAEIAAQVQEQIEQEKARLAALQNPSQET